MNSLPGLVRRKPACETGLTLIELMISMALVLVVTLAASGLLVSSKASYLMQDDEARMLDGGRYALEVIARSARQVAHVEWDEASGTAHAPDGARVIGLDARSLKANTPTIDAPQSKAVNGSDVLALRFAGSGSGEAGDGAMLNCAGFGVGTEAPGADPDDSRGWSIFYVAEDASGEPELYCKYRGAGSWTSQAIVRGVESFQVLYALDTDDDGWPNRLVSASVVDELDGMLVLQGHNAIERAADRNRRSHWRKVVAIRVALLLRGANAVSGDLSSEHHLFGPEYSRSRAAADPGVHIRVSALSKLVRNRQRRVLGTTIRLHPGLPADSGAEVRQ
jgi:type IV pilus assembly protein PilW